jgi:hypothetical protein
VSTYRKNLCPECRSNPRPGQRTCLKCHAAYHRAYRKAHPHKSLSPLQRQKANARSYAHSYVKRGKLPKLPCQACGSPLSQMHHPDYSQPLAVLWLCRPCHLAHHKKEAPSEFCSCQPTASGSNPLL